MGLFSGFSRLTRNLSRVVGDVAPIVAAVAPIVAPGVGGFLAGALAQQFIEPGIVGARPLPVAVDPCQRPAFSAPFRARFNPSGGSPAGRDLAFFNTFQPRSAVGRQVVSRCPPNGSCPCPSSAIAAPIISDPRVAAIAQAQGLTPQQQQAIADFSGFQRNRFGRI